MGGLLVGLWSRRIIIVLGAVAIVYSPTLLNGFVYDEHSLLLPISAYWNGDLMTVLTSPANGVEYQPVRDVTLMLDAWVWGRNPLGFHLSSLAYYLLAAWIAYHAVLKLATLFVTERPDLIALITVLIFACHPINSEVVYFISARNNILALIFVLLSLTMFVGKRWLWSMLFFVLALSSKASVVYYPMVLALLCIVWPKQDIGHSRAHWMTLGAMLCLNIAAIILHLQIGLTEGTVQPNLSRPGVLDLGMTVQRALLVPAYYFYRFLVPWPLNVFLDEGWIYNNSTLWISGLLFGGYLASLWAAWRFRSVSLLPLVGLVWFYVSLIPVSNLFPTHPMLAERYMFQGLFGLSLCLTSVAVTSGWRKGPALLLSVLLVIWAGTVFHRGQDWRNDQSLYGAAFRINPDIAAYPYVISLLKAGDHMAVEALMSSDELPEYLAELAKGELAASRMAHQSAQVHFDKALALGMNQAEIVLGRINFMMARNLESLGRHGEAMVHYLKVIDNSMYWSNRFYGNQARESIDFIRMHTYGETRARLEAAAIADPDDVRALAEFGLHLLNMGEYAQAAEMLSLARRLEDDNFGILYNLGLALLKQGDNESALQSFEQADSVRPHQPQVQNHLALLYAGRGEHEQAIALWRSILNREQDNFNARFNLARLYIRLGEADAAVAVLRQGAFGTDGELGERYRIILNKLSVGPE